MNSELKKTIEAAISTLKSSLSVSQLGIIKHAADEIYDGGSSVSESWEILLQEGFTENIRDAFHNIGYLISIPRTGAPNILREAYNADLLSRGEGINFLQYQSGIKEEVYELLGDLGEI